MDINISNTKTYADLLKDTENQLECSDDEYFFIDTKYADDENVDYEIIFGNEKIVFIKVGAKGSVKGYENTYRKMAKRIHEKSGATVICASNPDAPHQELDEEEIKWVIAEKNLTNFEISFIGVSDGAWHNLSLAKQFPETVKFIGINTSYITIHSLKEKLLSLPNIYIILIYGTNDIDFNEITPEINKITNENLVLKSIDGADHSFTGMVEEFIALADYLN